MRYAIVAAGVFTMVTLFTVFFLHDFTKSMIAGIMVVLFVILDRLETLGKQEPKDDGRSIQGGGGL